MELKLLINKIKADSMLENKIIARNFNFDVHAFIVGTIAGENFEFDKYNQDTFRLLLYYFNGSSVFETMFPENKYSLRKGNMFVGPVGTGKTTIMEIFKKYCNYSYLPHMDFYIEDVRNITNYFKRHGNTDKYSYNFSQNNSIESKKVFNLCLDDLGTEIDSVKHFGTDANPISDLLLDRYNIFKKHGKITHITTNLSPEALKDRYGERISDRMKEMVNVIPILGDSRRK